MENLDFSNFTDVDINSLGTFLRGLAQEELKKLPEKILLTAIRRLGEETGLPEDKLKARAYLAVELFKVNFNVFKQRAGRLEPVMLGFSLFCMAQSRACPPARCYFVNVTVSWQVPFSCVVNFDIFLYWFFIHCSVHYMSYQNPR